MAKAKKPAKKARRRTARKRASGPARAPAAPRGTADAERQLLALAARLSAAAAEGDPSPTSLRRALDALVATFAADAALAIPLMGARRVARTDKRAALALAWAREQLRLAIEELLAREVKADRIRPALPLDTLAWLVLVAAESLVHEPPGAAGDRAEALFALAGSAA